MRFFLVILALSLSGCETIETFRTTYDGAGDYQQLQKDRYDCAQESVSERSSIDGSATNGGARIYGSSDQRPRCGLIRICLASKGWTARSDGSGRLDRGASTGCVE